jgi:predicted DNA-binding protein
MAEAMVQKVMRIPPDLNKKLEEQAQKEGATQTEIIIRALKRELEEK